MHEAPRHERGRALALDDVRGVLHEHSLRLLRDPVVVPVDAQVLRGKVPAQRPSNFVRRRRVPRWDVVLRVEQTLLGRHAVQIRLVLRGSKSGAHGVGGALVILRRDARAGGLAARRASGVRETRRVETTGSETRRPPRPLTLRGSPARVAVRARVRNGAPRRVGARKKQSTSVRQFSTRFRAALRD